MQQMDSRNVPGKMSANQNLVKFFFKFTTNNDSLKINSNDSQLCRVQELTKYFHIQKSHLILTSNHSVIFKY